MSSREDDIPEPSTSAASTSQAAPAALPDNNQEKAACPECRDVSTACSSSCRHCFCQLCLWDWSLDEAVCPRCRRPTRHPYPQHVALYHEVQDRVYDSKRRWRGHSAGRPWSCSGHFGHRRPWERRRRRSMRWPRDGRWQPRHSQDRGSSRRWWQQRRIWEDAHGEGRAPGFELDVPASSRGSQSRRRSSRSWSQQERSRGHDRRSRGRERSHSWDRRQGRSSRRDQDTQMGSHGRSARQRRRRSWDADDRHTPTPQHDVLSARSERRFPEWEDSDSSGSQHATRSRSWGRSHGRGQDTRTSSEGTVPRQRSRRQRRWRSQNAGRGRAPRSQRDIPGSSGRRRHRRRSRSRARRRDT